MTVTEPTPLPPKPQLLASGDQVMPYLRDYWLQQQEPWIQNLHALISGQTTASTLTKDYAQEQIMQTPQVQEFLGSPWGKLLGAYLMLQQYQQTGETPLLQFSWSP
jgi:hypothetical protein